MEYDFFVLLHVLYQWPKYNVLDKYGTLYKKTTNTN
jgi:hypothetical protein